MQKLPRFMNRGLIEAQRPQDFLVGLGELPRFMNRGLIEAAGTGQCRSMTISLPRFMNRGLIEATPSPKLSRMPSHTSPIHESGPH